MEVLRKAFKQALDPLVSEYVNCVDDDTFLIDADIKGSIAHATMLGQCGLISENESNQICDGLLEIAADFESGQLVLKPEFEDVHMNVEKNLELKIGSTAGKLHTGRSRNDQVALDIKIATALMTKQQMSLINGLQLQLLAIAEKNIEVVMPGYTHLQRAQPVSFAHAMHGFIEMLERDYGRFADSLKRIEISPLGAGALAGSSLPTNPEISSELLGWGSHFANSLDAVSERDAIVEFLSCAALTAVHLSQMAETFIIWASSEFGFVQFSDAVSTASSLMPNKKNPDPVELVRGKTGAIVGDLVNVLVTLKALPLGYNRDLQETKPPLVHGAKCLSSGLKVMTIALSEMSINKNAMHLAASDPFVIATDLAEYLVNKNVPFRQAHEAVSALVAIARDSGKTLPQLSLKEFQACATQFENDVFQLFDPIDSVSRKVSKGSTGFAVVADALLSTKANLVRRSSLIS